MDTGNKITRKFAASIILIVLMILGTLTVAGWHQKNLSGSATVYAAETVQKKVEEDKVTEDDVDVENVDPSTSENLQKNLYIPMNTLIVFGGIIVILGAGIAITAIAGRASKKKTNSDEQ